MKATRSTTLPPKPAPERAPRPGPVRSWVRFWFTPADPAGLHGIRLLAGLLFLAWLLPLAGQLEAQFGLQGWFDQTAVSDAAELQRKAEAGLIPFGPPKPITWSVAYLAATPQALKVVFWGSIAVLACFTLGVWPRVMAVLTYVVVASFTANPAIDPDADILLLILAFYLMVGYLLFGLGDREQSPARRVLGPALAWPLGRPGSDDDGPRPSYAANLAVRLLQVHFAIVVCTSGVHKLQFSDWWAGTAFWYSFFPVFETTLNDVRSQAAHATLYLWLLSAAAYATLAWQIGFPFFAWRPRWRPLLLGGAVLGWLGSAFLYHTPLFGPALLIGCLSYVTPAGWHRLTDLVGRMPGLRRPSGRLAVADDETPSPSPVIVGQR